MDDIIFLAWLLLYLIFGSKELRDGTLRPLYPLSSVRRRIKSLARSFEKVKMGFGVMINSDTHTDNSTCFI